MQRNINRYLRTKLTNILVFFLLSKRKGYRAFEKNRGNAIRKSKKRYESPYTPTSFVVFKKASINESARK